MNLYIIQSVLYDGMVCIAAENLDQCRELFIQEFFIQEFVGDFCDKESIKEYDAAIKAKDYKVLKVINQEAGVVSYVYGGS